MIDAGKKAEALAGWKRLDGRMCPECGADGDAAVAFDQTYIDDNFSLSEGGWFTEWYRCNECGAQIGVSRRFAPAGDVEVEVEGR